MKRLMIVDDERSIRESLRFALGDMYEVTTAQSGEECLNLLSRQSHDMVITDYKMSGLNGLQLLESLAPKPVRPIVILFSAYMTPELSRQARQLGASACLSKPFDLTTLKERISDVLTIQ